MEILHLTKEQIKGINKSLMERKLDDGDFYHVRDDATLDFIVYRHQNANTIEDSAAELLFGIAINQVFANGNKRTSVEAAQVFLDLNKVELNLTQKYTSKELEETVLKIANNKMNKKEVISWLKQSIERRKS